MLLRRWVDSLLLVGVGVAVRWANRGGIRVPVTMPSFAGAAGWNSSLWELLCLDDPEWLSTTEDAQDGCGAESVDLLRRSCCFDDNESGVLDLRCCVFEEDVDAENVRSVLGSGLHDGFSLLVTLVVYRRSDDFDIRDESTLYRRSYVRDVPFWNSFSEEDLKEVLCLDLLLLLLLCDFVRDDEADSSWEEESSESWSR